MRLKKCPSKEGYGRRLAKDIKRNAFAYCLIIPVLIWYIVFCYVPMWGVLLPFKNYKPFLGFDGSKWVGLKYFKEFFGSRYFGRTVINTLMLNVWELTLGFTAPIILALVLNEVKNMRFKKLVQTVTYMPHFVSLVVVCGMIHTFTTSSGLITQLVNWITGTKHTALLGYPEYFRPIYTISGIWQNVGWNSIIYLSAMSSIDPGLYEAAELDGAGRFRRMLHVTLPQIAPTIIILLIFQVGGMMASSHEKIILLYNESIYSTADVLATFVYRRGLLESNFSYSSAVGLFSSVINLFLLLTTNMVCKKYSDISVI